METTDFERALVAYVGAAADKTEPPAPAEPIAEEPPAGDPQAAGVAVHALDTGRVLFIQRALIDGEPNGGLWEIPGGSIDGGETPWEAAQREFGEEVGYELPPGDVAGTWLSPNGVYRGFLWCTPEEASLPIDHRTAEPAPVDNPDNPQNSNYTESVAWMDPAHLDRGPRLLRPEMRQFTPWGMFKDPTKGGSMAAAGEIEVTVRPQIDWSEAPWVPDAAAHDDYELEYIVARAFSRDVRDSYASKGVAMPDGSFPIPDKDALRRAIQSIGRAKDRAATIRHIKKRARALGATDMIPKEWSSMTAAAEEFEALVASLAQPASALLPETPLDGPTPYTVKDDGTADGHLALWASCHVGYPGCVKPPREDSFDFYNLGEAVTADGRRVSVGKVTVGCGHAGPELSMRSAAAHYDESGCAVAAAHAVPDRWGVRLPSVLVADATGPQIDELRRSPLSGDWRRINGKLRLVAALAVNVPGFPVPRAMVASGEVTSMFVGFNPEDAAALVLEADSLAASLGLDPASRAAALRAEVLG